MNIEQEAMMNDQVLTAEEINTIAEEQAPAEQPSFLSWLIEIFRVESPANQISDYQNSPLCFDGSEGLGQILRGVSGFIGADFLRSAILDIIVGFMKWTKPNNKPVNNNIQEVKDGFSYGA